MSSTPPSARRWCRLKQINDGWPRGGHDAPRTCSFLRPAGFNYRAREGHDLIGTKAKLLALQFQLPCPRRARPSSRISSCLLSSFNYRARGGHDKVPYMDPSLHPSFNYRARGGHDFCLGQRLLAARSFNYRARGGHDFLEPLPGNAHRVSTTVPAEGTTTACRRRRRDRRVSTTVPAEGTT